MNEAALRARSLTLKDGQVVVPIEDVLALAATPSGGPLPNEPDPEAVKVSPGVWRHWGLYLRGAATPSGGPLDVERLKQAMGDHENAAIAAGFEDHTCDFGCAAHIAAEYARLTEDAG